MDRWFCDVTILKPFRLFRVALRDLRCSVAPPPTHPSVTCTSPYGTYAIFRTALNTRLTGHPHLCLKGWTFIYYYYFTFTTARAAFPPDVIIFFSHFFTRLWCLFIKDSEAYSLMLPFFPHPFSTDLEMSPPLTTQNHGDTCIWMKMGSNVFQIIEWEWLWVHFTSFCTNKSDNRHNSEAKTRPSFSLFTRFLVLIFRAKQSQFRQYSQQSGLGKKLMHACADDAWNLKKHQLFRNTFAGPISQNICTPRLILIQIHRYDTRIGKPVMF